MLSTLLITEASIEVVGADSMTVSPSQDRHGRNPTTLVAVTVCDGYAVSHQNAYRHWQSSSRL